MNGDSTIKALLKDIAHNRIDFGTETFDQNNEVAMQRLISNFHYEDFRFTAIKLFVEMGAKHCRCCSISLMTRTLLSGNGI